MARNKKNSNQREKRNAKQALASKVKKAPDYAARRLSGKFGLQTMQYLGFVEMRLIDIICEFNEYAEKLGDEEMIARSIYHGHALKSLVTMPDNVEILESCLEVWKDLSEGRIGTYTKAKEA